MERKAIEKMGRKVVEKRVNNKNITYALVTDETTYEVWKLCENYSSKVRGGIAKTWRYVQKGLDEEEARQLFDNRTMWS